MKEKFSVAIISKNGRRKFNSEMLPNTPSFWNKQAKLDSKAKVKTSYNVVTTNGKQKVSSVRSEFANGDVVIATNIGQFNKTVSRGKAPSHKKNSLSSSKRKKY